MTDVTRGLDHSGSLACLDDTGDLSASQVTEQVKTEVLERIAATLALDAGLLRIVSIAGILLVPHLLARIM